MKILQGPRIKIRHKSPVYDAVQWFEHGDHPAVHPYPETYPPPCDCGASWKEHGRFEFLPNFYKRVCPGYWILTAGDYSRLVRSLEDYEEVK